MKLSFVACLVVIKTLSRKGYELHLKKMGWLLMFIRLVLLQL